MRGAALCLLLITVVLAAGCTREWSDPATEGVISLRISRPDATSEDVAPRVVPQSATKIRIRVWHPEAGVNLVATVPIKNGTAELNLAVPENEGYIVDVVSYVLVEGRATALTGGRAPDVTVHAKDTTKVEVTLRPWRTEAEGDEQIPPGEPYVVVLIATDADGLISRQTLESATLRASTTSFQAASAALPLSPNIPGVVLDHQMSFTATAPQVTALTTLYIAALVEFTSGWRDNALTTVGERPMYVELPNRHMGEALHQVVVDPTSGGIVIDITDVE